MESIKIDEGKDLLEGSDHVAMEIDLKLKSENNGFRKAKWVTQEYYSERDNDIDSLVDYIENKWTNEKPVNHQKVIEDIKEGAEKKLKKKRRRREGIERGQRVVENPWITEEIRKNIKERRKINRTKRNLKSEARKQFWERKYDSEKQSSKVSKRSKK